LLDLPQGRFKFLNMLGHLGPSGRAPQLLQSLGRSEGRPSAKWSYGPLKRVRGTSEQIGR
jgi:hypothetical protein